ncbi:FGGY-family carbohydrate kinase [Rubellimicrobium aerolatum]|uniref:ATP:glycerol 3-phosphotransferase n=1 Tax=Rubellimicrobium aerolatum TaxID=490979 RepID=A0ABW0S9J7_9RHOB|nr:FGGY family carbohydrate kinase [Rubellimicrobium aerolatum]MBP1804956.1 glycerol kinase [Rubellimicrobium aerolatum]
MATPRILALDQGTSSTKAVLFESDGAVVARASRPLASSYPRDGWAEQDAGAIWDSVQGAVADIVAQAGAEGIAGLAIANQRETLVAWDAETHRPIAPAILWQCRRTAEACAALIVAGHDARARDLTGLGINPLFPASKLGWLLRHVPTAKDLLARGRLRAGTVDSWLLWNLTGGAAFATDHSNASRTQLLDTARLEWSEELADLFGASLAALPEPRPSDSRFGETAPNATALPAGTPVLAMMGDSHAALYGHGVRAPGIVKATYGTGSSLMTLTPRRIASAHGLSGTIAWSTRAGGPAHALEGNITVSAQAAAFAAQLLGLPDAAALSDLAQTVEGSEGVTFVPALAGLGAPHWDDRARGTLAGLTLGSQPAHVARATLEAIALQIADVLAAMEQDLGQRLDSLRADGGASANDLLMQLQADLLDRPVIRGEVAEVGALGVATLAFASLGVEVAGGEGRTTTFTPRMDPARREALHRGWRAALDRVLHHAP